MFFFNGQEPIPIVPASLEAVLGEIRPPAPASLPVSSFPQFQNQTSQFRLSPVSSPQRIHQNNHRTLLGYISAPVNSPELPPPTLTLKINWALPLGIRDKESGIRHYTPAPQHPCTPFLERMSL